MSGFIQGQPRNLSAEFPEMLDDFVVEDSTVLVIDLFIDDLELAGLASMGLACSRLREQPLPKSLKCVKISTTY